MPKTINNTDFLLA